MKKILVVVDMQNDFIDGALGTAEAVAIVPYVKSLIEGFDGEVFFTRDTHAENYMDTEEGRNLPVPHCIKGTHGWQIRAELDALRRTEAIDKVTFGSVDLASQLARENLVSPLSEIEILGLCTDICVISNAFLLKAALPECEISVNSALCRGVSPESHGNALAAMAACQINII